MVDNYDYTGFERLHTPSMVHLAVPEPQLSIINPTVLPRDVSGMSGRVGHMITLPMGCEAECPKLALRTACTAP